MEALAKEKAQLENDLQEKNSQLGILQTEISDLQAALERLSEKSQASTKTMENWRKSWRKQSRRLREFSKSIWPFMPAANTKRKL